MRRFIIVLWACTGLFIMGLAWLVWYAPTPITNADRIWRCQSDLHC